MKKFLESEIPDRPPEECLFHVIPAPYEKSVSYGQGTARGPDAILEASYYLEAFDGIDCPCESGIFTHAPAPSLEALEATVSNVLDMQRIPITLGGEHTVTYPALKAVKAACPDVGVIQFDAHADLRDTYEDTPLSHACVMRRILDMQLPIFQIGVRSLSLEEEQLRVRKAIPALDGYDIGRNGITTPLLPEDFPKQVYITFDVDALDPAIMPSTGTPEPGGLNWFQAFECLEQITGRREVIGFDVVELAPIPNLHAPDFLAARLIYNLLGLIARSR